MCSCYCPEAGAQAVDSNRAVEAHRENIRAKLGLKYQPVSLRFFLLSLQYYHDFIRIIQVIIWC